MHSAAGISAECMYVGDRLHARILCRGFSQPAALLRVYRRAGRLNFWPDARTPRVRVEFGEQQRFFLPCGAPEGRAQVLAYERVWWHNLGSDVGLDIVCSCSRDGGNNRFSIHEEERIFWKEKIPVATVRVALLKIASMILSTIPDLR